MDKRLQGFLLALLLCVVFSGTTYAQQRDCYGDYMAAMRQAWSIMYQQARATSDMGYWYRAFNPIAMVNYAGSSVEYYARTQSAYYQYIACSAFPIK